jgi:uncharacterized protein (TIGR02265 family)
MSELEGTGSAQTLEYWLGDLERRHALAKPEHSMRGFFFKGMLGSIRALGDEALVQRCLRACGQEHFTDFFSYSVQQLFPLLATALPTLAERQGGAEEALRQIGRQASRDFLESISGKAMLLLAQGRPKPLIASLPAAFRVALNFGNTRLVWTGPTRGTLSMDPSYMPPPFHEGMVRQMLESVRARSSHVAARVTGELSILCEFSWE